MLTGSILWKTGLAAVVIALTSTLAGKKPQLAGMIIALPISSMIALLFTQSEFKNSEKTFEFARSILTSVPLSLLFFLPFLIGKWIPMPFWLAYTSGIGLVLVAYGLVSFK